MTALLLVLAARADEGAFDHRHALFSRFLEGAVAGESVDYALLASRRSLLEGYLAQVAAAEPAGFDRAQQLALYVNAYNAWTLAIVLDAGPPASIRDLDGGKVWDTRRVRVGGQELTLNELEHQRARALADGRVHAVVNCASRGCPPLPPTPLVPDGIEAQLDDAARRWVRTNALRWDGDTVALSRIFEWYPEDFAGLAQRDLPGVEGAQEQALWFVARFAEPALRDRLLSGAVSATWAEYDWALNRK